MNKIDDSVERELEINTIDSLQLLFQVLKGFEPLETETFSSIQTIYPTNKTTITVIMSD